MNLNSDKPRLGGDVTREGLKRLFKDNAAADDGHYKIYTGKDTREAFAFRPSQMTPLSPTFHIDDFYVDGESFGSLSEYMWAMRFREILHRDVPDAEENPRDGDKYNVLRKELGKSYVRVMEEWTLKRGFYHWQKAILIRVQTDEKMRNALRDTEHRMLVYAFDGDSFFGVDATRNTFRSWAAEVSNRNYLTRYPVNFPLSLQDISILPFICNGYNVFGAIYMALRETLYNVNMESLSVDLGPPFRKPDISRPPKRLSDRALFDAHPGDTIKRFQAEESRRRSDPPQRPNRDDYKRSPANNLPKDEYPGSESGRSSSYVMPWRGVDENHRCPSRESLGSIPGKVGNIGIDDAACVSEDDLMLCNTPTGSRTPVPIGDYMPPRQLSSSGYGSMPDIFREPSGPRYHSAMERMPPSHMMVPGGHLSPMGSPLRNGGIYPQPMAPMQVGPRMPHPMGPPGYNGNAMGPPRHPMGPPMGRPPLRHPQDVGPPHPMPPPALPMHYPAPIPMQSPIVQHNGPSPHPSSAYPQPIPLRQSPQYFVAPSPQPAPSPHPYVSLAEQNQFLAEHNGMLGPAEMRRFSSLNDLPVQREPQPQDRPSSVLSIAGRHYATVPETLNDPYQPPKQSRASDGVNSRKSRPAPTSPQLSPAVVAEASLLAKKRTVASPDFDWLLNSNTPNSSTSPPIENTDAFIQRVKARAQSRQN